VTPRLPSITARELVRALQRAGYEVQRQKGSHITLRHPLTRRTTVVPMHAGDVKRPLLRMIIQQAGLTEEDMARLL
jgi:predicted RNA binding protein YcfA (HicA-like mRNA interferase family)